MSRCFPYPPPGYEKIGTGHKELIEPIKRGEKAKKDRKEKKREKRDKEENWRSAKIDEKKHVHKKGHKHKRSDNDQKGQEHRRRIKIETEHFEKSSLTEERGHPVCSQNLCDSSDSTLNSSKRQKQRSPPICGNKPGNIRIRLPLQRLKDPEVLPGIEQPCAVLGMSDTCAHRVNDFAQRPSEHLGSTCTTTSQNPVFSIREEKPRSCSALSEIFALKAPTSISCFSGSVSPSELKIRDLIQNWVPPLSHSECMDLDDQEWLFSTKQNDDFETKRFKATSGSLSCESSTPSSRICYLFEADIYALPFIVPF